MGLSKSRLDDMLHSPLCGLVQASLDVRCHSEVILGKNGCSGLPSQALASCLIQFLHWPFEQEGKVLDEERWADSIRTRMQVQCMGSFPLDLCLSDHDRGGHV